MNRIVLIVLTLCCSFSSWAQQASKALQTWKNDKYSMFIHFGAYSALGGVWEGKPVTRGYSEQIRAHAPGLYSDTYEGVVRNFDPKLWNPDSVVALAKAAGMRSVVLTSKHHDGFCMFKSAFTKFNIVDATPYKRDIVKELAEACERQGMKFGLYYSIIDWHFPAAYPISSSNSDPIPAAHHEYNKNQVRELLTHYGPISELWFDMGSQTPTQSQELADLVHELQPDCMVSGRIGNEAGDFCVMGDNEYPNYKIATPWQTPASIYDETWGYRSWQEHGSADDKAREKLVSLLKVVSRGGNYLLNIGPRGDGTVVEFERDVLLKMGDWLRQNGEAVYGTKADPFPNPFKWGEVTTKGRKLYLSLLGMPAGRTITLPGITGSLQIIHVLGKPRETASFKRVGNDIQIILPAEIKSVKDIPVVVVEFSDDFKVAPANIIQVNAIQKNLVLSHANAQHEYSIGGVDYNSYYRTTVKESWRFEIPKTTAVHPLVVFSDEEKGKSIDLDVNGVRRSIILDDGEPYQMAKTGKVTWGPTYLNQAKGTGIGWGSVLTIDPSKGWPLREGPIWKEINRSEVRQLPTEPSQSWFVLQELTTDRPQNLMVEILSGDGIGVWLNGEQLLLHSNRAKTDSTRDLVLLKLKTGSNQLLVKLYNRYHEQVPLSITDQVPQVMYRKRLDRIPLELSNDVSWQLHDPSSPHQDLELPNLFLEWKLK
ncbi:alpha-L-fucosidase [Siphonobacter sp. SORGH_AS_1065]|uniref:alpha-L-fucosidase n=1 Tax=Siphonobacter sp. SORGH_AS_1065 TaxID=3041795 RepID=UPI00277D3BA6|nr:alpha-L-fucosidase [Siphonobacter sp. SORGH_AS_1065]MDQ1088462.1 alpha-L-fucosidase [Siphonobacter sp. SORGH_AS_1065]